MSYLHRLNQLAATHLSGARISAQLQAEGHKVSRATVNRRLGELRGSRTRAAHSAHAQVSKREPLPKLAEPPEDAYVSDDTAIAEHVAAIGELIDRTVDAAVAREVGDAESLRDRLDAVAERAGWLRCGTCRGFFRPSDGPTTETAQ